MKTQFEGAIELEEVCNSFVWVYSSFEAPFLTTDSSFQLDFILKRIDWFICTVNDCRVLSDVNIICIVERTIGPQLFHTLCYIVIPVESSYI
jgi:hypothetical protein